MSDKAKFWDENLEPSRALTHAILGRTTARVTSLYTIGPKLGQGQFGVTFHVTEIATGKAYACKTIPKKRLVSREDVEDVRREIAIMHHLAGHRNIVNIKGAYEDEIAVHIVMELCSGGELFDRIVKKGHFSERQAALYTRTIASVVETCHSLGVIHRDLKPENFLLADGSEGAQLKATDFGLSAFFKPSGGGERGEERGKEGTH